MKRLLCLSVVFVMLLTGCSSGNTDTTSSQASSSGQASGNAGAVTYVVDNLQFEIPESWTEKTEESGSHYYFYPPTDADINFLMVQFSPMDSQASITEEGMLDAYADGLEKASEGYVGSPPELKTNELGLDYGLLSYSIVVSETSIHNDCLIFDSKQGVVILSMTYESGKSTATTVENYRTFMTTIMNSVQEFTNTTSDYKTILKDVKPSDSKDISSPNSQPQEEKEGNTSSSSLTLGQLNALETAGSYLDVMPFSHSGLVKQLEYEGYTHEEAVYAADHCGADWNEQAVKSAKLYLDTMTFSRQGLIEQLEYEGFTHDQAVYGVEQNGY